MLEEKDRKRLYLGASAEEISEFANKIGYPVLLSPFGVRDFMIETPDSKRRVEDEDALLKIVEDVLSEGVFNMVHITKDYSKIV